MGEGNEKPVARTPGLTFRLAEWVRRGAWAITAALAAYILGNLNALLACWFHHGG